MDPSTCYFLPSTQVVSQHNYLINKPLRMKLIKISFLFFLAIATLSLNSCSDQASSTEEATEETEEMTDASMDDAQLKAWEATLEKYHDAMSASFHSAEEDNLDPLKERYKDLASVSKEWVKMPVPEKYNTEKITTALKDLEKESTAIASVVENGTDAEMKDAIYALHDVFHKVQELCMDH
jgi:hypothetical protein